LPNKLVNLINGFVYILIKKESGKIIGVYSNENQARADMAELDEKYYRLDIRIIDEPSYH